MTTTSDSEGGTVTDQLVETDVVTKVATEPDTTAPERRVRGLGFWALVGRHRLFAVVVTAGILLRVVAALGYRSVMWFNDSFDYLDVALRMYPHPIRPDGYSFLLWALQPFHSFALVATLQHAMGIAIAVMIYALLRTRFGLPGWGATLAAAPVLLDAYQIQLEHLLLSDVLFTFLTVSAITLLMWRNEVTWKVGATAGLLIGMAALTRTVGLPVLGGVVVFMLVRRVRWKVIVATVALCAVPMAAYSGWYYSFYGKIGMTGSSGVFLYSRTYKFADCKQFTVPVDELPLCPTGRRMPFSQDAIWSRDNTLHRIPGSQWNDLANQLGSDFAKRAIMAQPGAYLKTVGVDFLRAFQWNRTQFPDKITYQMYEFGKVSRTLPGWTYNGVTAAEETTAYEQGSARTRIVEPFAGIIRGYQHYVFLRGTLLGVILLIGLAGLLGGRRRRTSGVPWRDRGGVVLLSWSTAVGLLLVPAATAEFDYRYVLPTVPLACLAAALTFRRRAVPPDDEPVAAAEPVTGDHAGTTAGAEAAADDHAPEAPGHAEAALPALDLGHHGVVHDPLGQAVGPGDLDDRVLAGGPRLLACGYLGGQFRRVVGARRDRGPADHHGDLTLDAT
jgi:hypothetical protein